MVYVITDSREGSQVMLVKAANPEEVETKLRLRETQSISAGFAGAEMDALKLGIFTVVTV